MSQVGNLQTTLRRLPGGESSKRAALALPVEPVSGGDVGVRVAARRLFDRHELVAVRVRQRAQQELIDDGEDGGVATARCVVK